MDLYPNRESHTHLTAQHRWRRFWSIEYGPRAARGSGSDLERIPRPSLEDNGFRSQLGLGEPHAPFLLWRVVFVAGRSFIPDVWGGETASVADRN
jgi:hypothetical protein